MRKEEGKYDTKETRKNKARKEKREMLKGMMKALKYGMALCMAVSLSAYIPEIGIQEVKATSTEQQTENTKWTGTVSSIEPRNDGDIYHIYNGEELAWVAQQTNAGITFEDKLIILENDIDLDFIPWVPIGNDIDFPFMGTFEGNGKTISNLHLQDYYDSSYTGLFGVAKNASIQNFKVDHAKWSRGNADASSYNNVAVICADLLQSKLINITICDAAISNAAQNLAPVGGFACVLSNSSWIINCKITNSVLEGRNVGGIVSDWEYLADEQSYGKFGSGGIVNCASVNNEYRLTYTKDKLYAGSIVANINTGISDFSAVNKLYFLNNYASDTISVSDSVTADQIYIGGLIGGIRDDWVKPLFLANCYTATILQSTIEKSVLGAVIGLNVNSGLTISDVYYSDVNDKLSPIGSDTGSYDLKFTNKTDAEMKREAFAKVMDTNLAALNKDVLPYDSDGKQYEFRNWYGAEGIYPSFVISEASGIEIYPVIHEDNQKVIFIDNNNSVQVNALITPYYSDRQYSINWSIPEASGLTITASGLLSARNAAIGTEALLQAEYSGITETVKVRVIDSGQLLSLKINNPGRLEIGGTKKLTYSTYPANADASKIKWFIKGEELNGKIQYINENEIASLNKDTGLLTLKQQGKLTITVMLDNAILDEIVLLIQSKTWDGISSIQPTYENNTYHITTGAELHWIAEQTSHGNTFKGKTILLENSIDLGGKNSIPANWDVIGNGGTNYFAGTFDGQGFTINNLYSVTADATEFNGLFGWAQNAVIKNLNISGFEIGSLNDISENHKAGIIGNASGNIVLENIHVANGSVKSNQFAGGLAGIVWGTGTNSSSMATVNQCKVENVSVSGMYSGGLVGSFKRGTVQNSAVFGIGSVQGNEIDKESYIGGLIGTTMDTSSILNSYADIQVGYLSETGNNQTATYTGGLIGFIQTDILINNIYANGTIINKKSYSGNYLPGTIAGKINVSQASLENINNIYWNEEAIHENSLGIINGELKAFGTGDTNLFATNKTTPLSKTYFTQQENGLTAELNKNAMNQIGWLGWSTDGVIMPRLINTAPVMIEIKQDDLYMRKNETVLLETVMKPYNSTKTLMIQWEMTGDTASISLVGNKVTILPEAVTYASALIKMTAVDENGLVYSDSINVTVMPDETEVTNLTIKNPGIVSTGDKIQLEAVAEPANALKEEIIWSIKKGYEDKGTITKEGLLTAKVTGTIIIEARFGSKVAQLTLIIQSGQKWDGVTVEEPDNDGQFYYIKKASELAWIAQETSLGHNDGFKNKTVVLMNDIDLNSQSWTPIGYSEKPFKGIFNGYGNTISSLSLDHIMINEYGLFGTIDGAEIKNLCIDKPYINQPELNGAILVGAVKNSTINNVIISNGRIDDSNFTGLFVRTIENADISNIIIRDCTYKSWYGKDTKERVSFGFSCTAKGTVNLDNIQLENNKLTGICNPFIKEVIFNKGIDNNVKITNTRVSGDYDYYINNSQWLYFGGFIGVSRSKNLVMQNCSFNGNIRQRGSAAITDNYVGGLVGWLRTSSEENGYVNESVLIENCYTTGSFSSDLNRVRSNSLISFTPFTPNPDKEPYKFSHLYSDMTGMINGFSTDQGINTDINEAMSTELMKADNNIEDSLVNKLNANINTLDKQAGIIYQNWVSNYDYPTFGKIQLTNIKVTPTSLVLRPGESYQLSKEIQPFGAPEIGVIWSSSNTNYATVDSNGNVTILKSAPSGKTVKITMTPIDNSFVPSICVITIVPPFDEIISIILSGKNECTTNETLKIMAAVYPETADETAINWIITNKSAGSDASISTKGTLNTGSVAGEIVVEAYAKANPDIKGTFNVLVKEKTLNDKWIGNITEPVVDNVNKTIHIQLPSELAWIAKQTNSGEYNGFDGYHILLDNDLNLDKQLWTPIGTEKYCFMGVFNGNGHTISNLYTDNTSAIGGLFGYVKNLSLSNLIIEDITIEGKTGGLLAYLADGNSNITNISINGTIQNYVNPCDDSKDDIRVMGGLFGSTRGGSFINIDQCFVHVKGINLTNLNYIGGLVGSIGNSNVVIRNNQIYIDYEVNRDKLAGQNNSNIADHYGGVLGLSSNCNLTLENNIVFHTSKINAAYLYSLRQGGLIGTLAVDGSNISKVTTSVKNNYIKNNVTSNNSSQLILRKNEIFGTLDSYNNVINDFEFISYYDTSSVISGTLSAECKKIAAGNDISGINIVKNNVVMVDSNLVNAPASNPDALVNRLNQWVNINNQNDTNIYKNWIVNNDLLTFGETATVNLDRSEHALRIGESEQLIATVLPVSANSTLSWVSSNPNIVSVDQKGMITGLIPGTSIITATTIDGYSASCIITVGASPTKLILHSEGERTSLIKGDPLEGTLILTAESKPVEAREIHWSVSDESIISIIPDDNDSTKATIVAEANGNASVIAETENGIIASLDVSVIVPVKSITLTQSKLEIDAAHELIIDYQVNEDAMNKVIHWKVLSENTPNTSVLTIIDDSSISFKGSSVGDYEITAESEDGYFTESYLIKVTEACLDTIKILADEGSTFITIERGIEYTLRSNILPIINSLGNGVTMEMYAGVVYEVVNQENHPGIKINGNILLADETVMDGEKFKIKATTTLTDQKGKPLTDEIECIVSRTELQGLTIKTFDDEVLPDEVGVGERLKLIAEATPKTASDKSVIWSVDDPSIAVIDEAGYIQFIKEGIVKVKASSQNGLIVAEHSFTVKAIYATQITIKQGEKVGFYKTSNLQLTTDFYPQNVTQKKLTYDFSNDPNKIINNISEDGLITFNLTETGNNIPGTAIVKVIAESNGSNEISDEIIIICSDTKEYVTAIKGIKQNINQPLHVGDKAQYGVLFEPSEANQIDFKWEVLKEDEDEPSDVAAINENTGEVTALAKGNFRIRVSIDYGAESSSPDSYISDSISIQEAQIETIGFNVSSLTLNAGSLSPEIKAVVQPKNYVSQKVKWSSNSNDLKFVDREGSEVYGYTDQPVYIKVSETMKPGMNITIKAQAEDSDIASTFNVLILRTLGSAIQVDPLDAELIAGKDSLQIYAVILANDGKTPASSQEVLFSSSNPEVAEVDRTGVVKPKLAGITTITIKSKEDETITTSLVLNVKEPALDQLNLNYNNLVLLVGSSDKELRIELPAGSSADDFEWFSSDKNVLSLQPLNTTRSIKLQALKPGEAVITVQQKGNEDPAKVAQCHVKIVSEPVLVQSIELSGPENAVELNEVVIIKASLNKNSDMPSNETLEWWSDSPEIIKVLDETGTFTRIQVLKAQGSVTIHARAKDGSGIEGSIVIKTAGNTPTNIQLSQNFILMSTSGSETIRAVIEPSTVQNQQVTWTVDQQGIIQPINSSKPVITIQPMPNVEPGSYVTLTARTYNGLQANCTVLITDKKVSMIRILKSKLNAEVGKTIAIPLEIDPNDASKKALRWSISDESVLTIENNKIIPLKEGTAIIKAYSTDGSEIESNECTVIVSAAQPELTLTSLKMNIVNEAVSPGNQKRLKVIAEPLEYDLYESEINWNYKIQGIDELSDPENLIKAAIENSITLDILGKTESDPIDGPQLGLMTADLKVASNLSQLMIDNNVSFINVEVIVTINDLQTSSIIKIIPDATSASITSVEITDGSESLNEVLLKIGEQIQLFSAITVEGGEAANIQAVWISGDDTIASIDNDTGIVKAHKAGTTTIELTVSLNNASDYITKEIPLTVIEDLTQLNQVYLSASELNLAVGKSETLTYKLDPEGYSPNNIIWQSSNEAVAIVNDGEITTLSEGSTIITIDVDGYLGFCLVNVSSEFETPVREITTDLINDYAEIELSNDLNNPATLALNAQADSEATNRVLVYQSSDENVAVVDENGIITALNEGLAIITIRPISDKELYSKQVFIKVIPETQYCVLLDQQNLILIKDMTSNITALISPQPKDDASITYSWESSDSKVVEIITGQQSASITASSAGTAIITVTISIDGKDPITAQTEVTVNDTASSIDNFKVKTNEIEYTAESGSVQLSLDTSDKQSFTIISEPLDCTEVNITNSNPEVVNIIKSSDNTYELTARKAGSTQLTFSSIYDSAKVVIFNINVQDNSEIIKPSSIVLRTKQEKNTIEIGESVQLISAILPDNAEKGLYFSSSNQSVATVDQSGIVTGISEGQVTITAYSNADMKINGSIILSIIKPEPKPAKFRMLKIEDNTGKVYDYDSEIFAENGSYVFKVENTVSRKEIKVNYELDQAGARISLGGAEQASGLVIDFTGGSITYKLIAEDGTESYETISVLLNDAPVQDAEMTIESASINNVTYNAVKIDEMTYRVTVPYEVFITQTDLTVTYLSKYASNIYVGDEIQTSGMTEVNLSRLITYTLIGQNGKKQEVYLQIETGPIVKAISLEQNGKSLRGTIDESSRQISFMADESFDFTKELAINFTSDSYQNVNSPSLITLTPLNIFSDTKILHYTGTVLFSAEDGSTRQYSIMVQQTVALPKVQLTALKLANKDGSEIAGQKVVMDGNLVLITVPFGTDLKELKLNAKPSDIVIKVDGVTADTYDLSTRKTLTVTQSEYADNTYTLIVNTENGFAEITSVTLAGVKISETNEASQFNFILPIGTDLSALVPIFTLSDDSAKILINGKEYTNSSIDFTKTITVTVVLNNVEKTYFIHAEIADSPAFVGEITISQEIIIDSESEIITLTATPDNENGTVIFEAEADKFDFAEPFTIVYTATDGSTLYEEGIAISSGSTITLGTLEKSFILKNESDESVYTMKIIEKAGSIIDINKFDLINVPKVGTIYGRIDHDRKQIYLDVLVEYTENFTSMTLDIEADADMILVNGKLITGQITLDLSKPVNVTFMKNGKVITYEVITTSIVEGPYVSSFEILDTIEGTLTGTIDNKNRVINVETPMTISASDLRLVRVDVQTASQTDNTKIELGGGYNAGSMKLNTLKSELILTQNGVSVKYEINIVRPFINGDMNGDGILSSMDLVLLAALIN